MTTPPLEPGQMPEESTPQGLGETPANGDAIAGAAVPGSVAPTSVLPAPAARSRGSRRGWIIGGVTAVAVGIIAAGGYSAYGFLSGGGAQPEDVVPADAIAFVKVDLDPAAGQKLAIAQLASRFDASPTSDPSADEGREPAEVFASLLSNVTDVDVDYARDLQGWVGQRAAVAVLAPETGADTSSTKPLVVVASTDDAAATSSLQRLFPADGGYAVTVREGFAMVGTQDDTAVPDQVLADVDAFNQAEAAIGDNVALGYVDIDGVIAAAKAAGEDVNTFESSLPTVASPIGRRAVSFGVVAEPNAISLRGHAYGLTEASPASATPLIVNQGAVGVLALRGLSDAVASELEDAGGAAGAASLIDPAQIAAALGDLAEVQVALDDQGSPIVRGTVVTSDVSSTQLFWQGLGALGGLLVTSSGDQVTIEQPEAAAAFGPVIDVSSVTGVLPDAATANLVAWVDVNAIEASPAGEGLDASARELKAIGASISTRAQGDAELLLVAQFD